MPEREVKLSLMTYTDEAGTAGRYGFKGEKVNVHPDYVERFDELNVDQGPEYNPQRAPVEAVAPGTVGESGLTEYEVDDDDADDEADSKKAPAKKATAKKAT